MQKLEDIGLCLSNNAEWLSIVISGMALALSAVLPALERHRSTQYEKREQARLICAWCPQDPYEYVVNDGLRNLSMMPVTLRNDSNLPVYNVVVSSGAYQGAAPEMLRGDINCTAVGTLPPGTFSVLTPYPGEGMGIRIEAVIAFSDAQGLSWVRSARGTLREIDDPYRHMELALPVTIWGKREPLARHKEIN